MRITVRARRGGPDRWFVFIPASADLPHPELIDATALDQCAVGVYRYAECESTAVVELLLQRDMHAGDVHAFAFRLHHGHAASRGADPGINPMVDTTSIGRGFAQQGAYYSLQVSFERPEDVRSIGQTYQTAPEAPIDVVRSLRLNSWGFATMALERPSAGLHGIGWAWS